MAKEAGLMDFSSARLLSALAQAEAERVVFRARSRHLHQSKLQGAL